MNKLNVRGKVTILIVVLAMLFVLLGIAFLIVSSEIVRATHDGDSSLEIYGWAYDLEDNNNVGSAQIVYDYSDFLGKISNENNLDLYEYNYGSNNPPEWNAVGATLDKQANTLTLTVTSFPSSYVLGESFS